MADFSKKSFFFIFAVIFVTIGLKRIITRNTGFPTDTFDHTAVVLTFDLGLFVLIFIVISLLLEKTGLFKDKVIKAE